MKTIINPKSEKFNSAIGEINDDFIERASRRFCPDTAVKAVKPRSLMWQFAPMAAGLVLVAGFALSLLYFFAPETPPADNNVKISCSNYNEYYEELKTFIEINEHYTSCSVISARVISSWVNRNHGDGVVVIDGEYFGASIYSLYYTVEVLAVYEDDTGFNVGDIIEVDSSIVKTDGSDTLPDDENPELADGDEVIMFLANGDFNVIRPYDAWSTPLRFVHCLNNFCDEKH